MSDEDRVDISPASLSIVNSPPRRIHHSYLDIGDSQAFCRRYHEISTFRNSDIVIYGGATSTSEPLGSFLLLNPRSGAVKQYNCSPEVIPPARTGHCGAVVTIKNSLLSVQPGEEFAQGLLIVGGWRGPKLKTAPNDVWFLDIINLRWIKPLSQGDTPGSANLATLNALGRKEALLFLGGDGSAFLNELYVYDLESGGWWRPLKKGPSPDPRGGHSSAVVEDSKLIIFGGWNGIETLADCWMWNRASELWTEVDMSGSVVLPGPRTDASLSVVGDQIFLLGGRGMWKKGKITPFMGASTAGLRDSEAPALVWDGLEWEGKIRVGHKATVCGSMIVVLGGFELKDETDEEPTTCSTAQFIVLDQQPGFTVERSALCGSERIPELSLFCCSECLADVKFDIQGFVFPAHRVILCLKSIVFRRMFTRGLTESKPVTSYPLRGPPDIAPCLFEIFLFYLYTYDLPVAVLKQNKAPWSRSTDRETLSRMIAHILTSVSVDESLRHSGDPLDTVRIVLEPKLLATSWPSYSLPFSEPLRQDLYQTLLVILQLADEYMITSLFNLCEVLIAHLVDDRNADEAIQWAVALKASSLLAYLEWMQRHPKSGQRPISVDMKTAASKAEETVLKRPVLNESTATTPSMKHSLEGNEDFAIGFPTMGELPNAQSSWAGPHKTFPDDVIALPPAPVDEGSSQSVYNGDPSLRINGANITQSQQLNAESDMDQSKMAVITDGKAVDDEANVPPFPDDLMETVKTDDYQESSERSHSVSEPNFESDKDPPFPGLKSSQDMGGRRESADHSVRSSPVRTPTFDPTYVEQAGVADAFEPLPPASPARKLSHRIVGKFRRCVPPAAPPPAPSQSGNDQAAPKSDKSFTQRFRNKFTRKFATGSTVSKEGDASAPPSDVSSKSIR